MAKAARRKPQTAAAKPRSARRSVGKPSKRKPADVRAIIARLTVPELNALISAATARRDQQIAAERASFLDEVKTKARGLGMSLNDLLEHRVRRGGPKRDGAMRKTDKAGVERKPAAAKYRNPATGDTWSGRGRPARWLTQLELEGRKRDEFAV